jgi:hypothetical protein
MKSKAQGESCENGVEKCGEGERKLARSELTRVCNGAGAAIIKKHGNGHSNWGSLNDVSLQREGFWAVSKWG